MAELLVTYCAGCSLEIYDSDDILETECGIVHNDFECLKQAANATANTGYQYRQERLANEQEREKTEEFLAGQLAFTIKMRGMGYPF